MKQMVSALTVAIVAFIALCGTSNAAPIAPLPATVAANTNNVIQAYYYHRHYYPYRWHGHYYPYHSHGGGIITIAAIDIIAITTGKWNVQRGARPRI